MTEGRGPFRGVAFVLAVTAFGAGIPTPLYAIYQQEYHFTAGVTVLIFAAYTLGVVATMILVAPLSDTLGRRPVLAIGMGLTALSAVVFILADGAPALAIARIVSGLAVGVTTSTATASMASLEPNRDQHHVARVSVAANFGGVAAGITLSGVLLAVGPAPNDLIFYVLIGASGLGALLLAVAPETVQVQEGRAALHVQRLAVPASIRSSFWLSAGTLAACYALYGFFASLAPSFVRTNLGISNAAAVGAIVAVMFATAALVQFFLAELRDRRALLYGLPIMAGGSLAVVLSLPLLSLALLLAGAIVLGIGVGCDLMGSVTLIDRVAPPEHRGEILSAYFLVGYLALAVPTIGIGVGADQVGLTASASVFGVILTAFALILWWWARTIPTPPGGEGRPRLPARST